MSSRSAPHHAGGTRAAAGPGGAGLSLVPSGGDTLSYLDTLFAALERADCSPRWKSNGRLRATCPVCGGGSTGRHRNTIAAADADGRLLLTCFRCAPQGCQASERAAWLADLLDLIGLDANDLGLSRTIEDATRATIDEYRAAIGALIPTARFRGQRGDTDLRLLTAAWGFALAARSTTFYASERQWALASGRGRDTCRNALQRLIYTGWLDPVAEWGVASVPDVPGGVALRGRQWRLSERYKKGSASAHTVVQAER